VAGSLDCAGCKNGQKPVGGRCDSSKCTGASYFDGKACQPCSPYCIKCQSASSCTQCITNFFPTNGYCTQCKPGCRRCDPSSSQCFECYPGLALNTIINDCVDRCQGNLKNENGYCVCINGVLDNSVCRQNCQTGYGPNLQKICEPCSEGCLSCSKVRATCEECEIGLNLVRGVCVRNMSCAVGQGQAPDGTCVNLCPSNKHFYKGYCVNACPKGTILNSSNLNCIDESPAIESCSVIDTISTSTGVCTGLKYIGCTPCRPGRFSYQSNCVNRCPVSTYPNSDNICLNCPSNCVQCNSSSNCLACAKGYYSFNGQCMQSTTCSPSQFSLGSNCVLNCPFGTYQDGTVCSPLCPAGQAYSKGWCVESCPSGTFNNTYGCDTSGNSNLGCRPNQYYDEGAKSCQPCNERCGSCVRFSQFCTTCVVGWPDGNGGCTGSGRAVQIHYINGSRDDKIVSL
jgi:proprotein convertase subtilisin/kexin type 5